MKPKCLGFYACDIRELIHCKWKDECPTKLDSYDSLNGTEKNEE